MVVGRVRTCLRDIGLVFGGHETMLTQSGGITLEKTCRLF